MTQHNDGIGRRVTAHDVARLAGVSQSTVSLVYRGGDAAARITPGTQQKVRLAGESLGYTPHHAARALRQQRTNLLGYATTVNTTWITGWLREARTAAREAGRHLLLLPAEDETALLQSLDLVALGVIDGLVLNLPTTVVSERARQIRGQGGAIVVAGPPVDGIPAVSPDLERAGRLAASHLRSLDHQHAAVVAITGSEQDSRIRGFLSGWENPEQVPLELAGSGTFEDGLQSARRLADSGVLDRVSAIFAFQDDLATGLMAGLHDLGHSVPEKISVVGCNNTVASAYLRPALTTIDLGGAELAIRSVNSLVSLIEGQVPPAIQTVPAALVVRDSTAPAGPRQG